jgi:serine/threonine protein kinase
MAPEIFREEEYDLKVDVWAIGVMVHEMLFGELYFIGKSHAEVAKNIIEKEYVIKDKSKISQECQDFLKGCLNKDPKKRFSATQLKQHELFARLKSMFLSIKPDQKVIDPEEVHDEEASVQHLKSSYVHAKPTPQEEILLEKLMNYRNGALMLLEIAEYLVEFVEECRFCIFFLLKRSLQNMHYLCNELNNKRIPGKILNLNDRDTWEGFLTKDHLYKSFLRRINEDHQACKIQYQVYLEELGNFLSTNFPEKLGILNKIVNREVQDNFDPLFLSETKEKSALFYKKGTVDDGKKARNLFMISYMLFLSTNIDDISVGTNFDFEAFNEKKEVWDVSKLKALIEKKSLNL